MKIEHINLNYLSQILKHRDNMGTATIKKSYSTRNVAMIDEKVKSAIADVVDILHQPIEIGSDAYLDKVLYFKGRFENLTDSLCKLSNDLIVSLNQDSEGFKELLPHLKSLHKSCLQCIDSFRSGSYGSALRTTLDNYLIESKQLREIIDDATNIDIIKADNELQSLFMQL